MALLVLGIKIVFFHVGQVDFVVVDVVAGRVIVDGFLLRLNFAQLTLEQITRIILQILVKVPGHLLVCLEGVEASTDEDCSLWSRASAWS